MDALVSTSWLASQLGQADLRVLDCTVLLAPQPGGGYAVESGRAAWEQAHIPGSAFADLAGDLSDPESPLRFTMPTPERFAQAMGALGVGDANRVVLYDSRVNMWAARVWWMLRAFGFDSAAVLDGGLAGVDHGRSTDLDRGTRLAPGNVHRPAPARPVRRQGHGAAAAIEQRSDLPGERPRSSAAPRRDPALRQARPHRRIGQRACDGARRRGHPPLPPAGRAAGRLRRRHRPGERVITYCGGGIAASSDAFVLHLLGHDDVAVYDNSLSE